MVESTISTGAKLSKGNVAKGRDIKIFISWLGQARGKRHYLWMVRSIVKTYIVLKLTGSKRKTYRNKTHVGTKQ